MVAYIPSTAKLMNGFYAPSYKKKYIGVICENLIDFNDWRFKNNNFKFSNNIKKNPIK